MAGRGGIDEDLSAEIEAHLDQEIEAGMARGLTPKDARAAARRHIGNLTRIQEQARDAWSFRTVETIAQDIRYGLRAMRRSPSFSLVVILTLTLGIGANTAIFSVVNAVLLRPLPYPAAERLVHIGEADPQAEGISVTWVNYQHWREGNHSFEDMAGFETAHFTLTGRAEPVFTRAGVVTYSFFSLVGTKPIMGRTFTAAEDRPGAAPTVVLDYQFWVDHFAGDSRVLGSALTLDGKPYEVIGVLAPALHFFPQVDFYVPLSEFQGAVTDRSRHGSMRLIARLKPGVTLATARADLDGIMRRLAATDPGPESQHRAAATFLIDSMTGEVRPVLLILLGAVGLVLLIACANVASLVLARGAAREREIAIRAAIGASRRRLVRQVLTESLLLAGLGGIGGALLAGWCSRALIAWGPRDIPRLAEGSFDWRVLLFAAVVTVATGLLTGFAPLMAAGRFDLVSALNDGTRSATGGRRGQAYRGGLVVAEIAVTLVLTFAAGLLIRSLVAAETADPGFAPDHLLALELVLPEASYKGAEAVAGFYGRLQEDLRRLPGVVAVGAVNCPPSAGDCGDWFYSVLGRPAPQPSEVPISLFNTADASYFRVMRIPLREGRAFDESDRRTGPKVAIVNETFARKWWPRETAVGNRIKMGGPYREGPIYEIVGVSGDVSQMGLDAKPMPEIYFPLGQSPNRAMTVMIRANVEVATRKAAVRRSVAAIDRNLPIQRLQPFEETVAASLVQRRFSTALLAMFAGLAVALAAVGVYGLLNYWVRLREAEIAIRMALGASRGSILRWSGLQVFRLAASGAVLGMAGARVASRWLESLVFGVSARSVTSLALAAGAVMVIALIAAAVPAWRAAQMDAARRLHHI